VDQRVTDVATVTAWRLKSHPKLCGVTVTRMGRSKDKPKHFLSNTHSCTLPTAHPAVNQYNLLLLFVDQAAASSAAETPQRQKP